MKIKFAWYDIWVGVFWDQKKRILYVCPLPMLLIVIPIPKRKRELIPVDKCDHDYKCVYEGWDSESYECDWCGDRYKLYDDEMR